MKIKSVVGFVVVACACAQAVDIAPKTEVAMRVALEQAVYTLDVAKVTSLLADLEAAHAHVELLPLLQRLSTATALTRRWPVKVGAVVAGAVGHNILRRALQKIHCIARFDGTPNWLQAGMEDGVFIGCIWGAYRGYCAWMNVPRLRARTIVRLLLKSPVIEVRNDADAVQAALADCAALSRLSVSQLVSATHVNK